MPVGGGHEQREVPLEQAWERKYPEQVALVVCADGEGRPNIITIGWLTPTSGNPPLLAIGIGHKRFSHDLIAQRGEFVVALPGEELEREMVYCGTYSGREVDKFKETGLTALPGAKVGVPLIAECLTNLECRVVNAVSTGDHTLFVGEIVAAHHRVQPGRRLYNLGGGRFVGL